MSNKGKAFRRIKNLIENDISYRQDQFARASMEHKRGFITSEQLHDYKEDAELAAEMLKMWAAMEAKL